MTRRPHHTEAETRTFWSVFEARMTDANNVEEEPLPHTDAPEDLE